MASGNGLLVRSDRHQFNLRMDARSTSGWTLGQPQDGCRFNTHQQNQKLCDSKCWKNGRRARETSGIECGQTREGSPGLCTSTYDVQMNVLSVGKWK